MTAPLRVALAGLGTVGAGVARLLRDNADTIADRAGRPVTLAAASARDRGRDRGIDLSGVAWHDDPAAMAAGAACDAVVELIGGSAGAAPAVVDAAIAAGRPVVTANKALLALEGARIARAAEAAGVPVLFEAAVAGGVPVVKALREGLAANRITRVAGILNGTSNYILTAMQSSGRDFRDVLAEAQRLGYAEADPGFDIDGVDTAHKLAILASLAFGRPVDFATVSVDGIRRVSALDIAYADELGFRVKLLGVATQGEGGGVTCRVEPCLVPNSSQLAPVDGVFNAVVLTGDPVGSVVLQGRGAGAGPTASAVVADLIDLARGRLTPVWSVEQRRLGAPPAGAPAPGESAHYLRLMVEDRPGVIANVTAALRDAGVSLESVLQRGRTADGLVPVVLVTHDAAAGAIAGAARTIAGLDAVARPAVTLRIERG